MFTKSGIMVGLGEERNEVLQLMDDLRSAEVDFLTIGQYLQPTRKHHPVIRFVTPDEFKSYETIGYDQGLPAGLVEPADALVASRRRGFRTAARRARRAARQGGRCRTYAAFETHVPHLVLRQSGCSISSMTSALSGIPPALRR